MNAKNLKPLLLHIAASAAAVVLALLTTGCADLSGILPRAVLRDTATVGLGTQPAPEVPDEWWRAYGDEQLNKLVADALVQNPNIAVAQARIAKAQSAVDTVDAARGPQLNGSLDLTRQRYTATGAVPPPLAGSIRNSGTAQLSGSWELDFFGRNRTALDAALGTSLAAQADTQAARSALAANVVRSYFQLARIEAQLVVARRALAQREETLRLVRDRLDAGLDTRLELRQSESGLPEARQQIEALAEQGQLTRNALAALISEPNRAAQLVPPQLFAIKTVALTDQIPADLLGRRADVAAARWRVEAARRDIDSTKLQFYPNVNLIAFVGLSSIGLDRLVGSGSEQWGFGPAIRLPIFENGRLRATLRGRTADYDAAVESYNATVVEAVHEVADQLTSQASIVRQQAEQRIAQTAAEDAYDIARQRYGAGLGNYLNVLTAETAVLNQRRQAVDLAARALDVQAQLFRALGGGIDRSAFTQAQR